MDETGEQFVAYFLPTKETLEKRAKDVEANKDYDDEEEYDYKMARQYHWNVKSKASSGYEENYFIVFRGEAAHYNELETRSVAFCLCHYSLMIFLILFKCSFAGCGYLKDDPSQENQPQVILAWCFAIVR